MNADVHLPVAVKVQAQAGVQQPNVSAGFLHRERAVLNASDALLQLLQPVLGETRAVVADAQDELLVLDAPRDGQLPQLVVAVVAVRQRVLKCRAVTRRITCCEDDQLPQLLGGRIFHIKEGWVAE